VLVEAVKGCCCGDQSSAGNKEQIKTGDQTVGIYSNRAFVEGFPNQTAGNANYRRVLECKMGVLSAEVRCL